MDTIYYCFEKATGVYAGSGTPQIENDTHASTTTPVPEYDEDQYAVFTGKSWVVKTLNS